ncbi:NADP-dependent oxidoreductase [Nostoc sp. 3335mG]|nr:NADP-dependent oxidoreductase [Nostoc sp. 3335mG]
MSGERPVGQRVALARYPEGDLQPSDFAIEDQATPAIGDGEFLVRNLFVSVDPMLRLFVDAKPLGGSFPGLPLGTTVPGAAVGEIVESNNAEFPVGTTVEGRFGWQHYAKSNGAGVNIVSGALGGPEQALGIGGLPGFTAYVGLHVADLKPGQTVLVSGAAGAVGSVVGPLAASRGIRAVGIASGPDKAHYLVEQAGYAAVADRAAPDFADQLKAALPDGANVYFDNVGGPMLAQVIGLMARGGLVLVSGLMAQYQGEAASAVDNLPPVLRAVMGMGVRIQGFTQVGQNALRPGFEAEMAALVTAGKIKAPIHIEEGIERLPHALWGLFNRSVAGKVVVRVAEPTRA